MVGGGERARELLPLAAFVVRPATRIFEVSIQQATEILVFLDSRLNHQVPCGNHPTPVVVPVITMNRRNVRTSAQSGRGSLLPIRILKLTPKEVDESSTLSK